MVVIDFIRHFTADATLVFIAAGCTDSADNPSKTTPAKQTTTVEQPTPESTTEQIAPTSSVICNKGVSRSIPLRKWEKNISVR